LRQRHRKLRFGVAGRVLGTILAYSMAARGQRNC
jgi:hypothetical protein